MDLHVIARKFILGWCEEHQVPPARAVEEILDNARDSSRELEYALPGPLARLGFEYAEAVLVAAIGLETC